MLTEAEKKSDVYWEVMKQFCIENPNDAVSLMQELIQLTNEFEAAAEFEARVAKKLAQGVSYGELPCGADPDCPDKHMDKYNTKETPLLGCRMCVLRAARFEIEAKMEEEGKGI